MIRVLSAILILNLVFISGSVPPMEVKSHSIKFEIENAGITVKGSLPQASMEIRFDPDHLDESQLTATADASAISTGIKLRDKHLLGREYFYVGKYPVISLKSKSLRKIKGNKYTGTFELTLRDKTKDVEIPFNVSRKGGDITLSGKFSIDRMEFGVGEESIILSNDVRIEIEVVGKIAAL
jgi:polyisoprenoid-binding protein YceI